MAEIINTIKISADSFGDLKTYLDRNPEYLLFFKSIRDNIKSRFKARKRGKG